MLLPDLPPLTEAERKLHFPLSLQPDRLLETLAQLNRDWQAKGESQFGAQTPHSAVLGCSHSSMPLPRILDCKLNEIFMQAERGARLSAEKIGTLMYGLTRLNNHQIPLVQILVHQCQAGQNCRKVMPDKPTMMRTPEMTEAAGRLGIGDLPGIRHINLPAWKPLSRFNSHDLIHGRMRSLLLLRNDPEFLRLIASGKAIIAEAFFDEKKGKVNWFGLIAAEAIIDSLPELDPSIEAILAGTEISGDAAQAIHPGLRSLAKLAQGNQRFIQKNAVTIPCRVVMLSCADGRSHPAVVFGEYPLGLIESFHSAGNEIDDHTLRGLRIAVGEVAEHARQATSAALINNPDLPTTHREHSYLVVKAHSRCGALNAIIASHMAEEPVAADNHTDKSPHVGHLVSSIKHRLQPYFEHLKKNGLQAKKHDEFGILAARFNAIEACLDIYRRAAEGNTDAAGIVEVLRDGYVKLVPAVYLLKTGRVEFLDTLPSDFDAAMLDTYQDDILNRLPLP